MGKAKIGYGKDFWGAEKSLNASNVKTMTDIKTDGNKCRPLWINHCCKISFRGSKSHLQQTMRGSEVLHGEHYRLKQHCLWGWMKEAWCCFTAGYKNIFSTCNTDRRLILYRSSNKWRKLLSDGHFLSSPIPWSILSTAIHFPLVPQERNYCRFTAASQGEFICQYICSKADVGLKLWCIRLSPTRR